MKILKYVIPFCMIAFFLSGCIFDDGDQSTNASTQSGSESHATSKLLGRWLAEQESEDEIEKFSFEFLSSGRAYACKWQLKVSTGEQSPYSCNVGSWDDVGAIMDIWQDYGNIFLWYDSLLVENGLGGNLTEGRAVVFQWDTVGFRWPNALIFAITDTSLTFLGDFFVYEGEEDGQLYGTQWVSDYASFTLNEDHSCSIGSASRQADTCQFEISENGRYTIIGTCYSDNSGSSGSCYIVQGHPGIQGNQLYVLDFEDPVMLRKEE